jgi:hypothetical protein
MLLCTNDINLFIFFTITYVINHNKDILHIISYNEVYNARLSYTTNTYESTIM